MPKSADNDVPLGMAIRSERERLGRSQERVARDAGIATANYARVENGQANPTWATVRDIARALSLDVSELVLRADRLR